MEVHYSDYLRLEDILHAQHPMSNKHGEAAHDEMLFIVIHQAYELWFRQIIHELGSCQLIMKKPSLNDNSPELQTVVHRLRRIAAIFKLLVNQIDVMETMTPMDFLDFRDLLTPASGFQSLQFKSIEVMLGLKFLQRHGQELVKQRLRPIEVEAIQKMESEPSLLSLVNDWLERMPFFEEPGNWDHYESPVKNDSAVTNENTHLHRFWQDYRLIYKEGLAEAEMQNLSVFDTMFLENRGESVDGLSPAARRSALFIMLYRGYPVLQLPFQLLNELLEIDAQMSTWRYRHMNMVSRMIGGRIGTGGSTGASYLRSAMEKHYIFRDVAMLTSFLIERRRLPSLSKQMETRLGFVTK
jgi:tryptophan 2,3-dioxygenase